jgi:hypothetical protein
MYLSKTKRENGSYPPIQSEFRKGLLFFPDSFLSVFYPEGKRAAGFVDLVHDGTTVTACTWNEAAYQAWCDANPEPDYLGQNKATRIAQSKAALAAYLESHPLLWTDGEYYSITAEKQQQLTSKLMAATMAQTLSSPYDLTWNSTGEVCKSWTLQDLSALAFAIDTRVTALVSYQQTQEVAMRNAETQEALDAIVVDYDSVPLPGGTA